MTIVALVAWLSGWAGSGAWAQAPGGTAIGGQIGEPAGLSLKFQRGSAPAIDFLAAFDLDDFFFLNAHLLYEEPFGEEEGLHVLYGPGVFLGVHDRAIGSDEAGIGITGTVGVGYYVRQFEIYLRVTPRLSVLPDMGGDVGGGLGVRWFF